jgi:transposase
VLVYSSQRSWKPIYNLLEGRFTLLVVNAQHIKAVPGRKTDTRDAEWIANLLRHGLLRSSFIPSRELRELRELTRYRKALIQERADELNRLQKVLEGANIKLSSVVSSIAGVSSRAMLGALSDGRATPEDMAELARGRMRKKIPELRPALVGSFGDHQRYLVSRQLGHIDYLEREIEECSLEIERRLASDKQAVDALCTIPGVGKRTAESILAEIGTDMSRFPSHRHLASWAGLCPGNHESAGKRLSGRTRNGNRAVREVLVEAALAAARTRNTYLSALYHRLAARRGGKRAVIAVAHAILVITYHLLADGGVYVDLGPNHFDHRARDKVQARLTRRPEALGFQVTLTEREKPPAAS